MIDTVVVGRNSFLAQRFREYFPSGNILYLSHGEALSRADDLKAARIVVNFSYAPALSSQPYQAELDSDSKLARMIGPNTHYVMLSSRMVYGEAGRSSEFTEKTQPHPVSFYGKSKLAVENSLKALLAEDKLTILRLSNIFGFEPERKTFFGAALTNLSLKKQMTFDIAPESVRDFLPVAIFSEYLAKILKDPVGGTFNIGSNLPVSCADITEWIIEGYGEGRAVFESFESRGEFYLNTEKAKKVFGLKDVQIDDIRNACIACGRDLKNYRLVASA